MKLLPVCIIHKISIQHEEIALKLEEYFMLDKTKNHRYISGLDGLRALAVLSVIAYHLNFSWAKGGFLGVDMFFVLSGYLITSAILPVQGNQLTINLREFWIKRIRRLLPAAYVMIVITFVWVMLFDRELLNTLRGDTIASIFYSSNWWFIFHEVSYFDSFGSPSPIKNLWSLAIEEQFYIIWPIILVSGFHLFKKRSRMSMIIIVGIICSTFLMSLLYQPGSDPSRVYYGTDTRSFELLIGCLLAFIWPMKRLSTKKLSKSLNNTLNITSFVALGIFISCIIWVNEYQPILYRGGMLLFCINAAILVACVCHPASALGKVLAWKPLRWLGTRSYGIYLWHYPVIVLGTPVHEIGNPVYWHIVLQLVIILIIAELSYRFIETPIRKNGFRTFFQQYVSINRMKWKSMTLFRKVSTAIIPLVFLLFTAGITCIVKGEEPKNSVEPHQTELIIKNDKPTSSRHDSETNDSEKENTMPLDQSPSIQDEEKESESIVNQQQQPSQEEQKETSNSPVNQAYTDILAIGDSVMIDIASSLHKKYPNMTIDAKVGRQLSQAVKLVPGYTDFNHPDKAVIIQLGTNGYFTNHQIDTLLGAFSNAHIYLVNTRVPRSWERQVNNALYQKAQENKNITLIDWYSTAIDHPEYFAADGVHLMPKGIETLTDLINQSINL